VLEKNEPLCTYGLRQIDDLLNILESNLTNAKVVGEIEYIHQSRVSSRRLRAALQVYTPCFRRKTVKRWREEVKKITLRLGETRDIDVQISYLEELTKKNPYNRLGIAFLLEKHRSKRFKLQVKVESSIIDFENSGTIEEIRGKLTESEGPEKSTQPEIPPQNFVIENLQFRFTELLSLEKYIQNEAAVKQHHQLRIAAKRLRYALELSQELYVDKMKPMITTIKGFQDILGEIHDADVWIEYIPKITSKVSHKLPRRKRGEIVNDLELLHKQVIKRRHKLYLEFYSSWGEQNSKGFLASLRGLIMGEPYMGVMTAHDKTLTIVNHVAQKYDPDPTHSTQVAVLALSLFDELSWLHDLNSQDRELLEYAAMLHDIGWYINQEDHSIHSREMILTDSDLPFNNSTRLMVANVARYHNKGKPNKTDEKYALLIPEEAHKVDELSAILRVADGLDASHNRVVKSLKVRATEDSIILECLTDNDYTMEEDAIRKKRKLFKKVFGKPLRIEWKTA
jgi:CHAD domain-containing protein/HD superfamily phosphodiesterase